MLPADVTHTVKPSACGACGHKLHGDDPRPLRHQVLELPVLKPDVTEYQLHSLNCPSCGATTCAELPAGVPRGQQGPRLQALAALLGGAYRLGKRPISTLLADVFGIPLCAGAVCKLERQTAQALEPVVAKLRSYVRRRPINMDETGWRENRQRAWLWVAATSFVTVFRIAASRSSAVVRHLLGPGFHWVLTSDRFSAYQFLALRRRQICWAHLRRDFQAMIDRGGDGKWIGENLLKQSDAMFAAWYRIRDGTITRRTFQRKICFIRNWVRRWLELGSEGAAPRPPPSAPNCCASNRRCGPSRKCPASSRPTMPRNALCVMRCCGAKPAKAPTALSAANLSRTSCRWSPRVVSNGETYWSSSTPVAKRDSPVSPHRRCFLHHNRSDSRPRRLNGA